MIVPQRLLAGVDPFFTDPSLLILRFFWFANIPLYLVLLWMFTRSFKKAGASPGDCPTVRRFLWWFAFVFMTPPTLFGFLMLMVGVEGPFVLGWSLPESWALAEQFFFVSQYGAIIIWFWVSDPADALVLLSPPNRWLLTNPRAMRLVVTAICIVVIALVEISWLAA